MCGIFGFDKYTPQTAKMIPILALRMEDRGKDSWGDSDGINIFKSMGKITETWAPIEKQNMEPLIYHTRMPSVGATNLDNAHPHKVQNENNFIIGIHNGTLSNNTSLNTEHNRQFSVDSLHIFQHLLENKPTEDLIGSAVVAYIKDGNPKELYLARSNSWALHVCKLDTGEIVFCSEKPPIEQAACLNGIGITSWYTVKEHKLHTIKDGTFYVLDKDFKLESLPPTPFYQRPPVTYSSYGSSYISTGYRNNNSPSYFRFRAGECLGSINVYTNQYCSSSTPKKSMAICDKCLESMKLTFNNSRNYLKNPNEYTAAKLKSVHA